MKTVQDIVAEARNSFNSGKTKCVEFREKQLKGLLRMYEENEKEIIEALVDDLRKPKMEAVVAEVDYLKNDVKGYLYHLKEWMKAEYPSKSLPNILDTVLIQPEPYGVVLIIGAWNYPIQLTLAPLAGAIAAGNCAIVKPSEVAASSAKTIAKLLPKYLDNDCFFVYNGGAPETTLLLKEKFDYIFYTGSPQIGKIIYRAATENLTPVTLELGGKSPVYLDGNSDMDVAVSRIIWGKCLNAGQTCIAPDYVLCTKEVEQLFLEAAKKKIAEFYGRNVRESPDYSRIINANHVQRLVKLLDGVKIAVGGDYDVDDKFMAPTIVTDVNLTDAIMNDEIFGPILPIYNIDNAKDAIDFINRKEKPLALYVFSNDKQIVELFLKNTSSGNFLANDTVMHFSCDSLPFGGVGNSGIGSYHGKFGFDTFSHKKGALLRSQSRFGETLQKIRYPPYSDGKLASIIQATKKRPPIPGLQYLQTAFVFSLGVVVTLATNYLA